MHLLALIGLGVLASSVAAAQEPGAAPSAGVLERRVDSLFTSRIAPDGPGCAVGVYRDGEELLGRGYGQASTEEGRAITVHTAFNLGSVSKPFTALAVLMLEEQGRLSLDDDVRRWVPELPKYGAPIRVRDLLQHTSGLRDYGTLERLSGRPVASMAEFLSLLSAQDSLGFEPGTRHEYSHSDYLLLGLIVERLAGAPFADHLSREVLAPLGMRGSFVDDGRARQRRDRAFGHAGTRPGAPVLFPSAWTVGGDNLYASVADLARWDRNLAEAGVGGPAIIARMLGRPRLPTGDAIPYAWGLRLGEYRGLRTVERGGHSGGMRTEILRFRDERLTVVTLCNAEDLWAGRFAERVADIYLGGSMRPVPPPPKAPSAVAVAPRELAEYAGVYRSTSSPWIVLPIELRNGALTEVLFHEEHDDTAYVMTPAGPGRFFEIGMTGNIGTFAFTRAARADPLRLEISWNGGPAEVLERIDDAALWRPSETELDEYAGTWFSRELAAAWRLERRGQRLMLHRYGRPPLTLRPLERDRFVRGFGSTMGTVFEALLEFHRSGSGSITHLTLTTPPGEESARNIRFVRVSD
jgi:CubicO group peptidase (beta-lactamase class C family)